MTIQDRLAPGKYKLTVEDFLRLDEAGVFATHRTELLDGDIIIMNAEYRPHGAIKGELSYRIRRVLEEIGSSLFPMEASVLLSDHDLPLPDIALTSEPLGDGPIPLHSVALIVEVAASTARRDLRDKPVLYARAKVPEYWVIDPKARVIHQMWSPRSERYAEIRQVAFGEPLTAATIEALTIRTDAL